MKIAFFWTWEFSKNILEWILKKDNIEVSLIVSQPDKAVWRKKEIQKTHVKILAEKNNIKIFQPNKLKDIIINDKNDKIEFYKYLKSLNLDFIIVVAYWKIIPKVILDIPKYFCINIHWSILPKYRWASPIQEAIKNWDTETWLTIMSMSEGMDEWDILKIKKTQIDILDKTPDIFKKFEQFWTNLLINTLEWIINWKIKWVPQDNSKATYCSKIKKEDWKVDFTKENTINIYNKFRAYYPWPWIYTNYKWLKFNIEDCFFSTIWEFEKNLTEKLIPWNVLKIDKRNIWIIWKDKKILILKQVKLEWKKSMDIISFINWNKNFLNYKF